MDDEFAVGLVLADKTRRLRIICPVWMARHIETWWLQKMDPLRPGLGRGGSTSYQRVEYSDWARNYVQGPQ
jgi:hypothetical protein